MKKLALFLVAAISLVLITGCGGSRKNVTHFEDDSSTEKTSGTETTVEITKIEDEIKSDPTPIEIPTTSADDSSEVVSEVISEAIFKITSPSESEVESTNGYHLIKGVAPKGTHKVMVNDYTLSKYLPGDKDWSYVAALSLGTLKKGENEYTVKALDRDGKELGSESLSIHYKGENEVVLAETGSPLSLAILLSLTGGAFLNRKRKTLV